MHTQLIRFTKTRKLRPCRRIRRGATLVEFALTIGLVFFFFFVALEFSRVAMLRHTVDHATYEACRVGVVPGATAAQVEARARQVLGTASPGTPVIVVAPNPIAATAPTVSVTIGIPLDQNLYAPAQFFVGKRFERTFTMERELPNRPR